uniref:Type I polyketide synthase n=1 Tax=Gambierdiscus excentricus TaxID=986170 RepID=A0A1S6K855_9DINO|nr:type I polyketide synthase [Gambierdiscus excentricus]
MPAAMVRKSEVDLVADSLKPWELGVQIVHQLKIKGFCTVSLGLDEKVLARAGTEIAVKEAPWRFRSVPAAVADSLLGEEGSACIAEIGFNELTDPALDDEKEELSFNSVPLISRRLQEVGFALLRPHVAAMGFELVSSTSLVLHWVTDAAADEVVEDEGEALAKAGPIEPELTEEEAMVWLDTFSRHRVMSIIFLGRHHGTLSLRPSDLEDAETFSLMTNQGMMVVLRPDVLVHSWTCKGESFAMSIFGLGPRDNPRIAGVRQATAPAAQHLHEWKMQKLAVLKDEQARALAQDYEFGQGFPRRWLKMMNQHYHSGVLGSVRSTACRLPTVSDVSRWTLVGTAAPDFATEVPFRRWDHREIYNPDPEGWTKGKSYCKHATFIDGASFFDYRMFKMPEEQAAEMDPHQTLSLEIGYAALAQMGLGTRSLRNFHCGVFAGCGDSEWAFSQEYGRKAAYDHFGVSAGRFSFVLGLVGPSLSVNTEESSGLVALHMATDSLQDTMANGTRNLELAVALSVHLCLAPTFWPSHCACGWLSPEGRCLTFNNSASGYIRGEGCCAAAVGRAGENGPGGEELHSDGNLAGSCVTSGGQGVSLSTPSGPAEQEAMVEAFRQARISPLDVDYVETHGSGAYLADAVEVGSHVRVHRCLMGTGSEEELPLHLMALKSSAGNQFACGSLASFLRSIMSVQWGFLGANLHLTSVNQHLDLDFPVLFACEGLEIPDTNPLVGTFSRGFGGSNVYIVANAHIHEEQVPWPSFPHAKDSVTFWPGGGGVEKRLPRGDDGYYLVGTWSCWEDPVRMNLERHGVYGCTVVLGENRWEQFQILLDCDRSRTLHPGKRKAPKDTAVHGPDPQPPTSAWLLDGRPRPKTKSLELQDEAAIADEWHIVDPPADDALAVPADAEPPPPGDTARPEDEESLDVGKPGDLYRVRLKIAGRWAMVTWERRTSNLPLTLTGRLAKSVEPCYHIVGSWDDWSLNEVNRMAPDPIEPGMFHAQVTLERDGAEFQIVRNMDWMQVMYPSQPSAEGDVPVRGPDDECIGMNWALTGRAGDVFEVRLRRQWRNGTDVRRVSWKRVFQVQLPEEQLAVASRPRFCIHGSWDDWAIHSMHWTGQCYQYCVELGANGEENFDILRDGQHNEAFFPNCRWATTHKFHVIKGPALNVYSVFWTVGRHPADKAVQGQKYKVELFVKDNFMPRKLQWSMVSETTTRESAPTPGSDWRSPEESPWGSPPELSPEGSSSGSSRAQSVASKSAASFERSSPQVSSGTGESMASPSVDRPSATPAHSASPGGSVEAFESVSNWGSARSSGSSFGY